MNKNIVLGLILVALGLGALISCATGPAPPKMGSAEFVLDAAKKSYAAGDYLKANENVNRIARGDSTLAAMAQPWNLVLAGGLASGYIDLANAYEKGSKIYGINPAPHRKQMNIYRTQADGLVLQFAEIYQRFRDSNKDQEIVLAFSYPSGSAAAVQELDTVGTGVIPKERDAEKMEKQVLQRGVLLSACRAAGAADDTAKALQLFQAGEVKVPRNTFLMAMAKQLSAMALLFDRTKLDEPKHFDMFNTLAVDILKELPDSKEKKDLNSKIEAAIKKAKSASKKSST